ncbi:MAG: PqqD family protein, partial [Gemmatimonadaceae bacterium]
GFRRAACRRVVRLNTRRGRRALSTAWRALAHRAMASSAVAAARWTSPSTTLRPAGSIGVARPVFVKEPWRALRAIAVTTMVSATLHHPPRHVAACRDMVAAHVHTARRTVLPTRHPHVVCMPVADGAVLLHTGQELYFGLNTVGVHVWELLRPDVGDLDALCTALMARYPEVDAAELRADVAELLDALRRDGLVLPVAT